MTLPRNWKPIIVGLSAEINRVRSGRAKRREQGPPEKHDLYEEYITGLIARRSQLELLCRNKTPSQYAAERDLTLSAPPHWTDFFKPRIKSELRQRQLEFAPTARVYWSEMFCNDRKRAERGSIKAQKIKKQINALRDELLATLRGEYAHFEATPTHPDDDAEQARLRLIVGYLAIVESRLEGRKKRTDVKGSWTDYLTFDERKLILPSPYAAAETNTPRAIVVHAIHNDLPPLPEKRSRGRPVGSKDAAPRYRRKAENVEKAASTSRRAEKQRYAEIVRKRDLGLDPYEKAPDAMSLFKEAFDKIDQMNAEKSP